MRVRRRVFRQSFVVTVVAGSSVAGACSSGESGGPVANPPPISFPPASTGGSAGLGGGVNIGGVGGGSAGKAPMPGPETGGATQSHEVTGGASSQTTAGSGGDGGSAPLAGGGSAGTDAPATGGVAGAVSNPGECPESLPTIYPSPCQSGLTCRFPYTCRSGEQEITRTCVDDRWVGPSGCDKPYDSCEGVVSGPGRYAPRAYCVDDEWEINIALEGVSSNPPTPCPVEPPEDGATCNRGATGGVQQPCGYPCAGDPSKWTVLSCPPSADNPLQGTWSSDGACN